MMYTWIFWLVFLIWGVSELVGPARWRAPKEMQHDRKSSVVLATTASTGFILCLLSPVILPGFALSQNRLLPFCIGIVLGVLGMALRWYSIRTLGRFFTGIVAINHDQKIVQHGPYRYLRHPSYTGILLIAASIGLMTNNWLSSVTMIGGMLIGLLYRISVEEQELRKAFQGYEDYCKRTKRLFPFLY